MTVTTAPGRTSMQVRKRNGDSEPVDVNKIVRAVDRVSADLADVDPMRVATRTISGLYDGATTADVLAQKPTGFNYDLCPGALALCGRSTPAESTTYTWEGADGPFAPPGEYSGAYCARSGEESVTNLAGTGPLTHGGNANNHQHWTQVYCGHEIQINESLTGGGQRPSSDAIKTGSVYGFRNLNAQQSRTYERLDAGVWHTMEVRTIGQQYTISVDGNIINQFDNSIPKIASEP